MSCKGSTIERRSSSSSYLKENSPNQNNNPITTNPDTKTTKNNSANSQCSNNNNTQSSAATANNNYNNNTSNNTTTTLIAQAMETMMKENNTGGNKYDSSKLAKLWLECEEENKTIRTEDALTAAIHDLLSLQTQLHHTERTLMNIQTQPTQEEIYQNKIQQLEMQVSKLEKISSSYKTAKERVVSNIKKKNVILKQMENKLNVIEKDLSNITNDNIKLQNELNCIITQRDTLKQKLYYINESTKETRNIIQQYEKRLYKLESIRSVEIELLDQFRKLAIHTGYSCWGKPIRALEAQLAAVMAENNTEDDEQEGSSI